MKRMEQSQDNRLRIILLMRKLVLLTALLTFPLILFSQAPAWSAKARNGYGFSPSYCDAYVRSQDNSDQFTIRFIKEGNIEFYYITNKPVLSKMTIILVFNNTPLIGGISYTSSYALEKIDVGVYKCLKNWDDGGFVFVTLEGARPVEDKEIVSLFKSKSSFRVIISSSNDYTTDWYEVYYSLKDSSKMITLAENYPYDKQE